MIGEFFAYGATALTAVGAVVFGVKQAANNDRTGVAARLKDVEDRLAANEKDLQMLKRREVTHERREGILIDTLEEHGISVPQLPAFPEVWTS